MRIAIISTYPPRQCGHAELSRHLAANLKATGIAHVYVIAMVREYSTQYGHEVIRQVLQDRKEDYEAAAHVINHAHIDVVLVEHEFSIFGGVHGAYLLDLLAWIIKPVIFVAHHIPLQTDGVLGTILRGLIAKSNRIVGITEGMQGLLQSLYQVSPHQYEFIPLGVSNVPDKSQDELKNELQLKNRTVAMTFGLLHPEKGIDLVLQAVPDIVRDHPDFIYLILGSSHPEIKEFGTNYYEKLKSQVTELGIQNHVRFVGGFLTEEEIMNHLKASDIYITPYRERYKLASHTLAYAAHLGKALLSTPYPHAVELTSTGGGVLTPFDDPVQLGARLKELAANPGLRNTLGAAARDKTKDYNWEAVAYRFLQLAFRIAEAGERSKNLSP